MIRIPRQRRRGLAQYQPLLYRPMYVPDVVQVPGSTVFRPLAPSPLAPRAPFATASLSTQPSLISGPVTAAAPVAAGPVTAPVGPALTAAGVSRGGGFVLSPFATNLPVSSVILGAFPSMTAAIAAARARFPGSSYVSGGPTSNGQFTVVQIVGGPNANLYQAIFIGPDTGGGSSVAPPSGGSGPLPPEAAVEDSISYAAEQGVSIAPFGSTDTTGTAAGGITDFLTAQTLIAGVSNWMIVAAAAAAVYFLGKKR